MAKMYLISEMELNDLRNKIEALKLSKKEFLNTHDPERHKWDDMFRSFNYVVASWMSEISK